MRFIKRRPGQGIVVRLGDGRTVDVVLVDVRRGSSTIKLGFDGRRDADEVPVRRGEGAKP